MTVFLDAALAKKYTNPSSDIISVLTGLNDADAVMTDFVATLDTAIRSGRDSVLCRYHVYDHADQAQLRCAKGPFEPLSP